MSTSSQSDLAVEFRGVAKTYRGSRGGKPVTALKGIDLSIENGDFFALLGPNGAGKSTAIGILCSLVVKSEGSVHVFGQDLDAAPMKVRSDIGLVNQEFNFAQFERVFDIVATQGGYYRLPRALARRRADEVLEQVGLADQRMQRGRELSGGMKRRLMIARALIHKPKLLVLDEPTAGVDIDARRTIWNLMRDLNTAGTTVILTTHYLEEAEELCRNVAIINHGDIVERSSIAHLLRQIDRQSFIVDVIREGKGKALVSDEAVLFEDSGGDRLEFTIPRDAFLNEAFSRLSDAGVRVSSVRPKANRIEQMFLQRTQGTATS